METECVGTSQQELTELRAQLQAATASAMEERQERQRLEVLLREQQSAQPTPAVVTSTPAAVISSATVTNVDTVISAPTN